MLSGFPALESNDDIDFRFVQSGQNWSHFGTSQHLLLVTRASTMAYLHSKAHILHGTRCLVAVSAIGQVSDEVTH